MGKKLFLPNNNDNNKTPPQWSMRSNLIELCVSCLLHRPSLLVHMADCSSTGHIYTCVTCYICGYQQAYKCMMSICAGGGNDTQVAIIASEVSELQVSVFSRLNFVLLFDVPAVSKGFEQEM